MGSIETKKLALIRIWEILKNNSDYNHPMTQEEIASKLEADYGIVMERKAISRNMSLLKEAGIYIESSREGSYLDSRDFDDSELRLLIDGVLSSKYIPANYSKDLIEKLCGLSNKYFLSHVRHIRSVNDWNKTDNEALFYNIELVDSAIEENKQLHYDYNKYGEDKKLHKSSQQYVTPYGMILHNQRYYLMAYSEYWGNMVYHRLDHITNMTIVDKRGIPLRSIKGYERGINYRDFSSALPYMYVDKPELIEFIADSGIIDQIVDWFGSDARITKTDDVSKVKVTVKASLNAMEHWATQYVRFVEIKTPETLRKRVKEALEKGLSKYN